MVSPGMGVLQSGVQVRHRHTTGIHLPGPSNQNNEVEVSLQSNAGKDA